MFRPSPLKKTPLQFLRNTPTQVLVKPVPPVIEVTNLPQGGCWYMALEYLVDSHNNPRSYTVFKNYAEQLFLVEQKRFFAEKSYQKKAIIKASKLAAETITQTLVNHFGFDEEKVACAIEDRILNSDSKKRITEDIICHEEKPSVTDTNKEYLLHAICLKKIYQSLDVQESKWTPESSFESLMEDVKLFGPLMVAGHFGKEHYSADAATHITIAGRKIYQYPKGSIKESDCTTPTHNVLIVGLEKTIKQNLIYFIDPIDQVLSPTPHPKIYVMSEKLFRENLYNIYSDSHAIVSTNKNYPPVSCPPFLLSAVNYGSLQIRFQQDQLAKRSALWEKYANKKYPQFGLYEYKDLQNLSLVSKKCNADFSRPVKEVEEKLTQDLTHYLR